MTNGTATTLPVKVNLLETIEEMSKSARGIWIVMITLLAFVGAVLMSVTPSDFFSGVKTVNLPLLSLQVPTRTFFIVGPLLILGVYGYFHIYQLGLWKLLYMARSELEAGARFRLYPWTLTVAILSLYKDNQRAGTQPESSSERLERWLMVSLTLASSWLAGIVILGAFWWIALTARSGMITLVVSLALAAGITIGALSFLAMWRLQRPRHKDLQEKWSLTAGSCIVLATATATIILSLVGLGISSAREADLTRIGLEGLPAGWLPEKYARQEFRHQFCEREEIENCSEISQELYEAEFFERRYLELRRSPPSGLVENVNVSGFTLSQAFLAGAKFEGADFSGANLEEAYAEYIEADEVDFQGAILRYADLNNSQLRTVDLSGAILSYANLSNAYLRAVDLSGAVLVETQLADASMDTVDLQGAFLLRPRAKGTFISKSNIQKALIIGGEALELYRNGVNDLDVLELTSIETGAPNQKWKKGGVHEQFLPFPVSPELPDEASTPLFDTRSEHRNILDGSALRFINALDLTAMGVYDEDISNTFGDASVSFGEEASPTNSLDAIPCHWSENVLSDLEFFGRWRGWLEATDNSDWPPSEEIGNLLAASNKYDVFDDGESFTVRYNAVRVRDIPAIDIEPCSATKGRPCIWSGEPEWEGPQWSGIRRCILAKGTEK